MSPTRARSLSNPTEAQHISCQAGQPAWRWCHPWRGQTACECPPRRATQSAPGSPAGPPSTAGCAPGRLRVMRGRGGRVEEQGGQAGAGRQRTAWRLRRCTHRQAPLSDPNTLAASSARGAPSLTVHKLFDVRARLRPQPQGKVAGRPARQARRVQLVQRARAAQVGAPVQHLRVRGHAGGGWGAEIHARGCRPGMHADAEFSAPRAAWQRSAQATGGRRTRMGVSC